MRIQADPIALVDFIHKHKINKFHINDDEFFADEAVDIIGDTLVSLPWEVIPLSEVEEIVCEIFPEHDVYLTQLPQCLQLSVHGHKFDIKLDFTISEIQDIAAAEAEDY